MEHELANHLLTLGAAYGVARKLEESTIGRQCAADGRFFSRIRDGKTLTLRKYDEVMGWFSTNWPEASPWPSGVPRPAPKSATPAAA